MHTAQMVQKKYWEELLETWLLCTQLSLLSDALSCAQVAEPSSAFRGAQASAVLSSAFKRRAHPPSNTPLQVASLRTSMAAFSGLPGTQPFNLLPVQTTLLLHALPELTWCSLSAVFGVVFWGLWFLLSRRKFEMGPF